jgi:hypothetical protein
MNRHRMGWITSPPFVLDQRSATVLGSSRPLPVKFGSIESHSPMRGHVGHPEGSQGDLENQPIL